MSYNTMSKSNVDWSQHNATIVGNVPLPGASANSVCPPGLESTQGPGAHPATYAPVSFGATREYKNDDDGWQTIKQRQRHARRGFGKPRRYEQKA